MQDITNQIMHRNLQTLLEAVLKGQSVSAPADQATQDWMVQRNWAFDFYLAPLVAEYAAWLEYSTEGSNYTYEIANLHHLAGWVDSVTGCGLVAAVGYLGEISRDRALWTHLLERGMEHRSQVNPDAPGSALYGRRMGWYAVARILKPRLVIETGVDKGLGACILCAALKKNAEEGAPGRYLGTDINPAAGGLLAGEYARYGEIVYGDSIETLKKIEQPIDLFINDSDHSAEYEGREYLTIEPRLHEKSVILADNSHVTDELYKFAMRRGMKFLHFAEKPKGHWYSGAGIGAAFPR